MVANVDFLVKVSREEVVAAVLPMQEHWLPLSNLDLLLPPVDVGVFFCYKKPMPIGDEKLLTFGYMVGVLKKALAQVLVSYYAFGGEIVKNSVGEPELLCNNRGVDFVEAFADVELQNLNLYNPDESIEGKLVPKKKQGVLSVQATELKCRATVVGCTFDHRVADAYSANMFLVSWAEMSKAEPLTFLPSYRRSLLNPRRPGFYDATVDAMYVPVSTLPPPKCDQPGSIQSISRIYYIEADQLSHLQSLASGTNNSTTTGRKRTKLEVFTAFLWKIIAAGAARNDQICRMGVVVDGRMRLSENESGDDHNLMSTYFGNVLSIPFGKKRAMELKERPLSWVADAVHDFLESTTTKEHFLGLIDWVEAHRPEPLLASIYATCGNQDDRPAFVVSSGQRFPISKVDFGWGKPTFGSYHFPWGGEAGYVMPMPSAAGNGDWVVYVHLVKDQLELIETHAAHVLKPMTLDYLNLVK